MFHNKGFIFCFDRNLSGKPCRIKTSKKEQNIQGYGEKDIQSAIESLEKESLSAEKKDAEMTLHTVNKNLNVLRNGDETILRKNVNMPENIGRNYVFLLSNIMAETLQNVLVAENLNSPFSPLTTLTMMEQNIGELSDLEEESAFIYGLNGITTRKVSKFYVGIAIVLKPITVFAPTNLRSIRPNS